MFTRFTVIFINLFLLIQLSAQVAAPVELDQKSKAFIQRLPDNYQWGWVEVPEDYSKPEGQKIHIFYYGPKNVAADTVPTVIMNGGPGSSSHNYYLGLRRAVNSLNCVFIDQRGTGASSKLPEPKSENIHKYTLYLSDNIVRDSELIRKKLFKDKKWSIAGHSYGSLIAHRYVSMFPESLHSVHAHGYSLISNPQLYPEIRLKAHKKNLDDYLKTYPADRELLKKVQNSLTDEDFIQNGDLIIRGRAIMDLNGLFALGMKHVWPFFHDLLNKVFTVDGKVNKEGIKAASTMLLFRDSSIDTRMSMLNIVFNRSEGYLTKEKSLHEFYKDIFAKLKKNGNDPAEWEIGEEAFAHFGFDSKILDETDKFQFKEYPELKLADVAEGLKKNKDLKFYLYSGQYDSFSPPEIYKDMAEVSDNVIYKNFEKSGHESFFSEIEFWEAVKNSSKQD